VILRPICDNAGVSAPTPLYLDHAASSPPLPVALEAFQQAVETAYANPGSLHAAGADAARRLETARRTLRRALGADGYRVVWTGTGTEGNHLGIQGLARAASPTVRRRGTKPRVLTTAIEHASAREAALALEDEGFQVDILPVDRHGLLKPETLADAADEDVVLASVQYANNEIGSVQPMAKLAAALRAKAPQALLHSDAVQAAGKLPTPFAATRADSLAVAAHKRGGLRGTAALLLREGSPEPQPLFRGGGHEGGLRSGTEDVMGAAAFAAAAAWRAEALATDPRMFQARRDHLVAGLRGLFPGLTLLGPEDEASRLGAVLAVAIPGIRAETFLHRLEQQGVLVGSGSACHAKGHASSPVLEAIGLPEELRNSVLRLSLGGRESEAELDRAVAAFAAVAQVEAA
jgi:cysteine desulfurase